MRVTVSEQSRIPVRSRSFEEMACLSHDQASTLIELGERMGARIASWDGLQAVRVHQFVGVLRVGDLHLEVLPKIDGLPEPAKVRVNLLAMLAKTENLDVRASEVVNFLEASEPFISALARLYCHQLLEAVRRGLRQDYVLHDNLLPHIRGKINWPSQARLQTAQRLEFSCIFDERSSDTPLNRTLKAALLMAGHMLEGTKTSSVVTELRHVMDGISDRPPVPEQVARLRTDRMNRRLEPLLVLAKLILGNRNPDLGRSAQGDRSTYALVWDMNRLFEEYVGRITREVLEPKGLRVGLQEGGSTYLAREVTANQNAFLLKPDILIREKRTPVVVADTKWKRLDQHQANLGVSEADVYQVLAYAHRYQTEKAALIYPHHPALGPPGLKREFVIQGVNPQKVRVKVITVDLATLETVPQQLESNFGSGVPALPTCWSSPTAQIVGRSGVSPDF